MGKLNQVEWILRQAQRVVEASNESDASMRRALLELDAMLFDLSEDTQKEFVVNVTKTFEGLNE